MNNCTNCKADIDAVTHPTKDIRPGPGDVTVCAYCGHVMVFTDSLGLRDPTPAEIVEMAGMPQLREALQFRELFRKWKINH